jgi:ABC-type multidrug transport system fused ATPase/permease subunit
MAPVNDERPDGKRPLRERFAWTRVSPLLREAWEIAWKRRGRLALAFPLILLNRTASLVLPGTTKFLIDDVIGRQDYALLPVLALAAGAAAVVEAVCGFALAMLLGMEAQKSITEYRRKIQKHLQRLPTAYFDATKTGTLLSRTMWDAEGIRNLVGTGLVQLAASSVTAAVALGILIWLSPVLTTSIAGLIAVFSIAFWFAMKALRPLYRKRNEIYATVMGRLSENYSGIRVVKAFRAERRESRVFAKGVHEILRNVVRTMRLTSGLSAMSSVLVGVVAIVILLVGGRLVISGEMTTGGLVSFTLYVGVFVAPFMMMVGIGTQLVEAFAGLERMREVFAERREDDGDRERRPLPAVSGYVEARNVHFEYRARVPVLRGVSFEARPGTTTALVGPSGSGKSTLVSLVASFYRPTQGTILVDGIDLATVRLDDYRRHVGIVPQDAFLFDGSLIENIEVGNPTAARGEVLEAARRAHVDEFAETLPDGYDTVVGERGVRLSGGQKQRVAIARAIVANPKILILDEATSSLDSESEALIRDALHALVENRTTLVIAHRLSTIRRADQILVLRAGEIVERGRHDELLALDGLYRRLYETQHELESNLFVNPGEEILLQDRPAEAEEGADESIGRHSPDLLHPEGR